MDRHRCASPRPVAFFVMPGLPRPLDTREAIPEKVHENGHDYTTH